MTERRRYEIEQPYVPEALAKLRERSLAIDSQLCVGIDIHPDNIQDPKYYLAHNQRVIEATSGRATAFKFQMAGYLAMGSEGIAVLEKSVEVARAVNPNALLIIDGKFNDIGVSLAYYAQFAYDHLGADAVTANPFLGQDANEPVIRRSEKLVYFLGRTSNPGAQEFQGLNVDGREMSTYIASRIEEVWAQNRNVGLVVGATVDPHVIGQMREAAPNLPFLMPGLGAQGASTEQFVYPARTSDPGSMLVNVSREITSAQDPGALAVYWANEIKKGPRRRIVNMLADAGCIELGDFTLASGVKSNIYVDVRRLSSRPDLLNKVAEAMNKNLSGAHYDVIATIPTGGLPLASIMAISSDKPMVYIRKESKGYGTKSLIEGGVDVAGKKVLLVDDVISSGGSKMQAIEELRKNGAQVEHIGVVVDRREQGGEDFMDLNVHSLIEMSDIL